MRHVAPRDLAGRLVLRARPHLPTAAMAVLLTIVTMSWVEPSPHSGFDISWSGALHMGAWNDLVYGRDVTFTYGPLGFLEVPILWSSDTGILAVLHQLASRLVLATVLLLVLRRNFGTPWALLGTYLLLNTTSVATVLLIIVVSGIALLASRGPQAVVERRARVFAVCGPVLAAAEILSKFNIGLLAVVSVAIVVLAGPRPRRDAPIALATGVSTLVVLWIAAGQPLGAIDEFFVNALRVASGYTDSHLVDDPNGRGDITVAVFVAVLGGIVAFRAGRGGPRNAQIGLTLLWAAFAYVQFRSAFVRQDAGHVAGYFGPLAIALAAFPWGRLGRSQGGLTIAIAAAFAFAATSVPIGRLLWPSQQVEYAQHAFKIVTDPGWRREKMDAGRTSIAATVPLNPYVRSALRGHRVHVWPSEVSVAWAYRLSWSPLPTLQSNSTFTPALDARNRRSLLDADGPDRVITNGNAYQPDGVRLASWDQPRTALALLCHFRPGAASEIWQVLERGPSRCGPARRRDSVTVAYGQRVDVPPPSRPDTLIFAKVAGMHPTSLFERLRASVYKGRIRTLAAGDGREFRVTPVQVGYGMLMRSAPRVDYRGPFAQIPQITSFTLGGSGLDPEDFKNRRLRVDFFEVRATPFRKDTTAR